MVFTVWNLAVWLLYIAAIVILLVYLKLIVKRAILIFKIKAAHPDKIDFMRSPFYSVFVPDGKTDILLRYGERSYAISIMTTPFRKCRYHFIGDGIMQVIKARKGMFMINPRTPVGSGLSAQIDHVRVVKKCRLRKDKNTADAEKIMLLHPAPIELSKVVGNNVDTVVNNDLLDSGHKVCGYTFFKEHIIKQDA